VERQSQGAQVIDIAPEVGVEVELEHRRVPPVRMPGQCA
jgi:hypothetical protein